MDGLLLRDAEVGRDDLWPEPGRFDMRGGKCLKQPWLMKVKCAKIRNYTRCLPGMEKKERKAQTVYLMKCFIKRVKAATGNGRRMIFVPRARF